MAKLTYSIGYGGKLHTMDGTSKDEVLSKAIQFHKENNINYSMMELSKAIDRQSKISHQKKKITLTEAIHGAKAVLKYTSGKNAGESEINRRASICLQCPIQDEIGGCRSCGLAGTIAKFVNTIRSSMKLEAPIPAGIRELYCGHCKCSLALIVVTQMDGFVEEDPKENAKRPDMCWLKTTSTSYKP